MLLTFAEAKASRELASVAGVCPDSDAFASLLNQSTRKLMTRGDFWATVQKVRLCVWNHCIVWPRWVGRIAGMNFCHQSRESVNFWQSFMPMTGYDRDGCCDADFRSIHQSGTVPVYRQIECDAKYVRVYCDRQADVGKTITLFGIDYNGQPIRTVRADGVLQEGVQLTLAIPFVSTPIPVRGVNRAVKDVTEGPVRLYQYDSAHDVLLDMAVYDPDEISPSYRFTELHNPAARCGCPTAIDVLVKLEFIPVRNDTDRVLIENLDALQLMMSGCKLIEQGNPDGARKMETEAVRELNLELRNRFPSDQTAVSNHVETYAPLSRVLGGMI